MAMNPKAGSKYLSGLYEAILKLETVEECENFFSDLCTIIELDTFAQRLEVARLLRKNLIYLDIVESTGASTATISRVNRALCWGKGGYETILSRLEEQKEEK